MIWRQERSFLSDMIPGYRASSPVPQLSKSAMGLLQLPTFCRCRNLHFYSAKTYMRGLQKTAFRDFPGAASLLDLSGLSPFFIVQIPHFHIDHFFPDIWHFLFRHVIDPFYLYTVLPAFCIQPLCSFIRHKPKRSLIILAALSGSITELSIRR